MQRHIKQLLLHAPLATVKAHLGLSATEEPVFSAEQAEAVKALLPGRGGARNVKEPQWARVEAIKAYGVERHVDEALARYRAHLQDLRAKLPDKYGVMDDGVSHEVRVSWGLARQAAPARPKP